MPVGIGYKGVEAPKTEFFQLPFNELLAGLSAKQKQFDTAEDEKNKLLEGLLKVNPYYSSDKEFLNQYSTDLYKNIDNLTNQYQGDISKALPEIKRLARKLNQDLTAGNLATINYNTEQAKKILDDIAKAKADNQYGQFSEQLGLAPLFQQRQQMSLQDAIDPETGQLKRLDFSAVHRQANQEEESNKLFGDIKADASARKTFDWNTGQWVDKSYESIGKGKIYNTALKAVTGGLLSPAYQAELNFLTNNLTKEQLQEEADSYLSNLPKSVSEEIKKAYPDYKENLTILKNFAKANYVGSQGERFIFSKSDYDEGIDNTYLDRLLKKQEENSIRELTSTMEDIVSVDKMEFPELTFVTNPELREFDSKGNLIVKKPGFDYTSTRTIGPGVPLSPELAGKQQSSQDQLKKNTENYNKQKQYLEQAKKENPFLNNKTEKVAFQILDKARNEAVKEQARVFKVSNIASNSLKDKLITGAGDMLERTIIIRDGLGSEKDVNWNTLPAKLGYTNVEDFNKAVKEATVPGFSLSIPEIPAAYQMNIKDAKGNTRRLYVAPDEEIKRIGNFANVVSKNIRLSANSGLSSSFEVYDDKNNPVNVTVIPKLDSKTEKYNFEIELKRGDKTEKVSFEDIINEAKEGIQSSEFLNSVLNQVLSKEPKQ